MLLLFIVLSIFCFCSSLPYETSSQNDGNNEAIRDIWNSDDPLPAPSGLDALNMITVPPNCPPGQKWVNGQCRDIWRAFAQHSDVEAQNMITVPPNCRPGQQWINGQCRDVWRTLADSELFQKLVESLWTKSAHLRNSRQTEDNVDDDKMLNEFQIEDNPTRNIINVPKQCPEGYKLDALGICRKQL